MKDFSFKLKWGHSSASFGTYEEIFNTIQRKNNFNRMIDIVNLYINDIASNKEEILSKLSDREKVLYEL